MCLKFIGEKPYCACIWNEEPYTSDTQPFCTVCGEKWTEYHWRDEIQYLQDTGQLDTSEWIKIKL